MPRSPFTRRSILRGFFASGAGVLAGCTGGAPARTGYRIARVDVSATPLVRGRTIIRMEEAIETGLRGRGPLSGRPVNVSVQLRTIDPYTPLIDDRRGLAVRYTVRDAQTGAVLLSSRFIERAEAEEDRIGTVAILQPDTQGTQERDLVRGVIAQLLRDVL